MKNLCYVRALGSTPTRIYLVTRLHDHPLISPKIYLHLLTPYLNISKLKDNYRAYYLFCVHAGVTVQLENA
jgi:hypothetical protein